ncbi:MAG TPA: hypothetical protein VLT47_15090 [Anaeromyxobacteraceae bacterium]|nr:hypothetical protein [Anaeromyxobacteraceae bacterium]
MNRPHLTLTLAALLAAASVRAAEPAAGAPATSAANAAATPSSLEQQLEALRKEIARLEGRLDNEAAPQSDVRGVQTDVENFKYQYQRDRETKSALSTRNLLIGGVIQARGAWADRSLSGITGGTPTVPGYLASTSINNPALLSNRNTTFDIPAAILSFNGLLFRDYEQARNLGFSLSAAAQPVAGSNNSNFNILDANVTYQLLPTIENDGPRLSVSAGQFLLPFGNESNISEELKPVINNAQFVPALGLGARQIGVVAKGELFTQFDFGYNYRQALLSFAAGVVSGTGPNRDDENGAKDVIGRVAVTFPAEYNSWLRELRVGASVYQGRANLNSGTAAAPVYAGLGRKNRYGVDVYYNHFPFGLTYEFVRADEEAWGSAAGRAVSLERQGHTFTAFYSVGEQFLRSIKTQAKYDDWWPKTFQPFLRWDRWDANLSAREDVSEIATLGLNVFFAETTKAQINVNRRVQQRAGARDATSHEVLAQIQFGF